MASGYGLLHTRFARRDKSAHCKAKASSIPLMGAAIWQQEEIAVPCKPCRTPLHSVNLIACVHTVSHDHLCTAFRMHPEVHRQTLGSNRPNRNTCATLHLNGWHPLWFQLGICMHTLQLPMLPCNLALYRCHGRVHMCATQPPAQKIFRVNVQFHPLLRVHSDKDDNSLSCSQDTIIPHDCLPPIV